MNCWEMLGIAETSDLAAIKKAYAAKAKEWHPEEYPEEFKRLQQAYQYAARLAKLQRQHAAQQNVGVSQTEKERQLTAEHKEENPQELGNQTEKERQLAAQYEEENPQELENLETGTGEEKAKEAAAKEERTLQETRQKIAEETEPVRIEAELASQDTEEYQQEIPLKFDYTMVAEADLNDQFFREFFSIAWNPYLMNNLICWDYLLRKSPYERLLERKAFRYNFVRTASSLSGWQRKTILFFEKWMQSQPAVDEACKVQKKETDLLCWRTRKIGLFDAFLSAQRCTTNDQKKIHDIFLAQVERCGKDKSLTSEEDVACYLSFYLPYAAAKQSKLKEMYHGNCQGRILFSMLLFMFPILIGMILYVNACVVPQMNEKARKEDEQQRIQQQADEIGKYNELLQDNGRAE